MEGPIQVLMQRTVPARVVGFLAALLCLEGVVLGLLCRNIVPFGVLNDDSAYVLQARQFVATGDVLASASDPYRRVSSYQPGEALILAPVVWLFPHSIDALRATSLVLTLATGVLWFFFARPVLGEGSALFLAAASCLNPPAMSVSYAVRSDVSFTLLTLVCFLLFSRRASPAVAFLAGLTCLFRPTGFALVGALVWTLITRRQFRAAALSLLAGATPFAIYGLLCALRGGHPGGAYAPQLSSYMQTFQSPLSYLVLYSQATLNRLVDFVKPYGAGGYVLLVPVLLLAVVGSLRRESRSPFFPVFIALYLGLHLFGPKPEDRYYLILWPILLFLAAQVLPRSLCAPALGMVVLVTLPGLSTMANLSLTQESVPQLRWQAAEWLRHHARPDARVMATTCSTIQLESERLTFQSELKTDFADFLFYCCGDHVDYLLYGPESIQRNVFGQRNGGLYPARLDLWLGSSTLFRLVKATPYERLFERTVPRAQYLDAYQHFWKAARLRNQRDVQGSESEIRLALDSVDDFPGARWMHAANLADLGRVDEAVRVLVRETVQYPIDTASQTLLASLYQRSGRAEEAAALLRSGIARLHGVASETDDGDLAEPLMQALAAMPGSSR